MAKLLTFEMTEKNNAVEVHFNDQGLNELIELLKRTKEHRDHQHLKTPEWAGAELTSEKQGVNNTLINHVRLCFWDDDV